MFNNPAIEKFCDEKWDIAKALIARDGKFFSADIVTDVGIIPVDESVTVADALKNVRFSDAIALIITAKAEIFSSFQDIQDADDSLYDNKKKNKRGIMQNVTFLENLVYQRIAEQKQDSYGNICFVDIKPFELIGGYING